MKEIWNLDPIYRGFDDPAFLLLKRRAVKCGHAVDLIVGKHSVKPVRAKQEHIPLADGGLGDIGLSVHRNSHRAGDDILVGA